MGEGVSRERIKVAESSVDGFSTEKALRKSGLLNVCDELRVEFLDLSSFAFEKEVVSFRDSSYSFNVSKQVLNSALMINVPVIKTHFQSGVSLALKNMKGVLDFNSRKKFHKRGLQEHIAVLNSVLPKQLVIGDGSIGLEGMGPAALGTPANLGLIFASSNPVAHDSVVCETISQPLPKHVIMAGEMGLGEIDISKLRVAGEELAAVKTFFEKPNKRYSPHQDIDIIDFSACSGCSNGVWIALNSLNNDRFERSEIVIGNRLDKNKFNQCAKRLGIGNCSFKGKSHMLDCLPGCPPSIHDQVEFIRKKLRKD